MKVMKNLRYKDTDNVMPDPRDTDIVIPVMGLTGAGKSTFINAAIGEEVMEVGHSLASCTTRLTHAVLPSGVQNHRIILLDTPGLCDTEYDDVEILRRIAVWLAHSYWAGMKLAGIIYLQNISQNRAYSMHKYLAMFRVLCGDEAIKRVVLVTSQWNRVSLHEGEDREAQLKKDFWNGMIALGAKTFRFDGTPECAHDIVGAILELRGLDLGSHNDDHLQIQAELVDFQKLLSETEAGRALIYELKFRVATLKGLDQQLIQCNAQTANSELQRQYDENRERLEATLKQIQAMKIPISRRILTFFHLN